jgi:predicted N-acetyltransferase YhbS
MEILPASALDTPLLAAIAERIVLAFGHAYPDWTAEEALAELRNDGGLPMTLVAVSENEVIGCASLLDDDEVDGFRDAGPWLGNVWIDPGHRHRGVGGALVAAVIASARELRVPELHLVTDSARDWYAAKGWCEVGSASVHGHAMTVMRLTL